ncbi:MAG: hypothetical protein V4692_10495, partial [Bdellovibrionota bacterium]
WTKYLDSADYDRATELIQSYQAGTITAEVFYGVVDKLLTDSNDDKHILAVYALGATPSTKSFLMLSAAEVNEKLSADVHGDAAKHLQNYATFEQVRYLNGVLTSKENEAASLRAIALLMFALNKAKTDSQPGEQNQEPGVPANPRAPASNPSRYFTVFQPTLSRIVQSGGNLSGDAQQALGIIASLAASAT